MGRPDIKPVRGQKAYVHMIVVADAGWGKTVFAGTAPKSLFLVTDPEGTVSAGALGSESDMVRIKTFADLEETYLWLRDEGGCDEYDWVIIDTVGGAQRILQRSILDASYAAAPAKRDPDVPSMDVHQKSQIQIIKMIMQFNDLPVNTLYTAHPYNLEDGNGDPMILPYVHGGKGEIAQQVLGHMNVAGYGVTRQVNNTSRRVMYFTHEGALRGKDRFVKIGEYLVDPTVPQMMAKLTAGPKTAKKAAARRRPQ